MSKLIDYSLIAEYIDNCTDLMVDIDELPEIASKSAKRFIKEHKIPEVAQQHTTDHFIETFINIYHNKRRLENDTF